MAKPGSRQGTQSEIDRKAQQRHLATACERGIELCRQGDWAQGLTDLAWLVEGKQAKNLPSLCYSYLGYGVAKNHKQVKKGRRLCKHAVKIEWFQPDNYFNLARTCLLAKEYRQDAYDAVRLGLKVDADHPGLLALQKELGLRRAPVIKFLSRGNILNRFLGSLLFHLTKPIGKKAQDTSRVSTTETESVTVG